MTSNEVNHTPGPWFAVPASDGQVYISDSNAIVGGRIIAIIGDPMLENDDEEDMNATLIAAAPDLLAALVKIAFDDAACADIPLCPGIGPYGHAEDCAVGIARAAIAKALGQAAGS